MKALLPSTSPAARFLAAPRFIEDRQCRRALDHQGPGSGRRMRLEGVPGRAVETRALLSRSAPLSRDAGHSRRRARARARSESPAAPQGGVQVWERAGAYFCGVALYPPPFAAEPLKGLQILGPRLFRVPEDVRSLQPFEPTPETPPEEDNPLRAVNWAASIKTGRRGTNLPLAPLGLVQAVRQGSIFDAIANDTNVIHGVIAGRYGSAVSLPLASSPG
jgi:hypothetical protein